MGKLLTAIGFLLVLVFAAAAAAPYLVDWVRFKPYFEQEATRFLGTPVAIDGAIDVRFLPSPSVSLEGVRIGREGAEARIGEARLEFGVGPILRGEIHIEQARLVGPKVWLAIDREGRLAASAPGVDLGRIRLGRIDVEGGEIALETPNDGVRLFVDGLAFGGDATSLAGPWRIEGAARFEGARLGFSLGTGRFEAGSLRLRLQVDPADQPVTSEFDGALALEGGRPVLGGILRLGGVGAADAQARQRGWRMEANVDLRPDRATARDVRLVPSDDRIVQFNGSVNIAIGVRSRLDAALSTRQLDLDRLAGVTPEAAADVPGALARVAALPIFTALPALDGRVSLDIGSVVLAGGLVQELRVAAEVREQAWRLTDVQARLPGQGVLKASGQFAPGGDLTRFDGVGELTVQAPSAFAAWVAGELVRPREARPAGTAAPISIAGRFAASREAVAVTGLRVGVGSATMTGEAALGRIGAGRRLDLRLGAPDIDIEPIVALAGAFAQRASAIDVETVDARIRADRVRYRGLDVRGLDLAATATSTGLDVSRLAGVLNGMNVTGSGRVGASGDGNLNLVLVAERPRLALEALDAVIGPHPLLTALVQRASALAPLALDVVMNRSGAGFETRATGAAGTTGIEATVTLDQAEVTAAALRSARFVLRNAALPPLLALIGAETAVAGGGAASVTVALERATAPAHRLVAQADLAGTRLALEGPVTLDAGGLATADLAAAASSSDVGPLLAALGIPLLGPEDRVPVALSGRLSRGAVAFGVSALAGTVADTRIKGDVSLRAGAAVQVDGALDIETLSLDRVLALASGPWPWAGETEVWAGAAFPARPLPQFLGSVAVSATRLELEPYAVTEARFRLQGIEGGVSIADLTGRLAGGRVSGEIAATRPAGGVRLVGRLGLEGARIEELVWLAGDRPVATGAVDLRLAFDGTGRTPAVLVGALTGEGTLTLTRGEVRRIAAGGFAAGLRAAEAGVTLDEARLADLVRAEMDQGVLPFTRLEAALALDAGVLRASNLRLDGAPVIATGRAAFDLPRWLLDAEWSLEAAPPPGAQRGPRIGLVFRGPIDEPERRIDVRAFVDYLNIRRFEREVERLETLQREIDQRERSLREMQERERERDRERREQEERTRAAVPPAPRTDEPVRTQTLPPLPPPVVIAPTPGEPVRR